MGVCPPAHRRPGAETYAAGTRRTCLQTRVQAVPHAALAIRGLASITEATL